jgi:hypothetical protein
MRGSPASCNRRQLQTWQANYLEGLILQTLANTNWRVNLAPTSAELRRAGQAESSAKTAGERVGAARLVAAGEPVSFARPVDAGAWCFCAARGLTEVICSKSSDAELRGKLGRCSSNSSPSVLLPHLWPHLRRTSELQIPFLSSHHQFHSCSRCSYPSSSAITSALCEIGTTINSGGPRRNLEWGQNMWVEALVV